MSDVTVAVVATVTNFLTYSLWTLCNKWQFQPLDHGGFGVSTPFAATSFQMLFAGLITFICVVILRLQRTPGVDLFSWSVLRYRILPLGIARAVDVGAGNFALLLVSVTLQQVAKSMLPVFVCILSTVLLRKHITLEVWISLIPVVLGTLLACVGVMSLSVLGVSLALLSCAGRAFKAIINARLLHGATHRMKPLEILLLESPTTGLLILFPMMIVEGSTLWKPDPAASTQQSFHSLMRPSDVSFPSAFAALRGALGINVVCGVLMFFNQASYVTIIERTSAVTCQVLMNLKMLFLIVVSQFVFHTHLSEVNIVGILTAACGCLWYAYVMSKPLRETEKKVDQVV